MIRNKPPWDQTLILLKNVTVTQIAARRKLCHIYRYTTLSQFKQFLSRMGLELKKVNFEIYIAERKATNYLYIGKAVSAALR